MDVLLETYYIILPIITTTLIAWVGSLLKSQKKKEQLREEANVQREKEIAQIRKANSEGIKLVLRYMLKRYHTEYVFQKKITYDQYKDWIDIYNAYSNLGGNSIAERWNEDIERLPKCDSIGTMSAFEAMLKKSAEEVK